MNNIEGKMVLKLSNESPFFAKWQENGRGET